MLNKKTRIPFFSLISVNVTSVQFLKVAEKELQKLSRNHLSSTKLMVRN